MKLPVRCSASLEGGQSRQTARWTGIIPFIRAIHAPNCPLDGNIPVHSRLPRTKLPAGRENSRSFAPSTHQTARWTGKFPFIRAIHAPNRPLDRNNPVHSRHPRTKPPAGRENSRSFATCHSGLFFYAHLSSYGNIVRIIVYMIRISIRA